MPGYSKQLPEITTADKPFWDAAKNHLLMAYQCRNCGTYYSQTTDCIACDNPQMSWTKVSGKGKVFTFCVYHQVYSPSWKDDIPYNVAWIKLAEGPLVISNIVGCKNEDIHIEMPVEVTFDDITDTITLPKFKPV